MGKVQQTFILFKWSPYKQQKGHALFLQQKLSVPFADIKIT